jgi:FixJ family two-component response regulator
MPGMNGRDLYRKLVTIAPSLKVLFMSGYMDDVIGHQGVLEPGLSFIQKPFAVPDLLEKVRKALEA